MKKIILFLAALIVLASGWYFYKNPTPLINKQSVKKITVSQSITEKNKPADFISYQAAEGETALGLLKKNARVQTKGEDANAYVIQINGYPDLKKLEPREYWAFYVNAKMAAVGAGSYILKPGDKIEWKIEKY